MKCPFFLCGEFLGGGAQTPGKEGGKDNERGTQPVGPAWIGLKKWVADEGANHTGEGSEGHGDPENPTLHRDRSTLRDQGTQTRIRDSVPQTQEGRHGKGGDPKLSVGH